MAFNIPIRRTIQNITNKVFGPGGAGENKSILQQYAESKGAYPPKMTGGYQSSPGAPKTPEQANQGVAYSRPGPGMAGSNLVAGMPSPAVAPPINAGFDAYKYPDDPTVYKTNQGGNLGDPFNSATQFLQAGGDWNRINVISRPQALNLPSGSFNVDPATGQALKSEVSTGLIADTADIFSMDDLRAGSKLPTSASAITTFLENLTKERGLLRQELMGLNAPTQAETDLETALSNLRGEADMLRINTQSGADVMQKQPIAQKLIEGQQGALYKQSNLALQTMATQERVLLERLGIEQSKRQGKLDTAKLQLDFMDQDSETFFKAEAAMRDEQKTLFSQAATLREDAQNILATIIDKFQGLDMEDLDPKTQSYLAQVAGNAGVPMGVLVSGMKVVKDKILFDQQIKQAELIAKLNDKNKAAEVLSPADLKTLTDLGYDVTPGQTIGDLQGQIPKNPKAELTSEALTAAKKLKEMADAGKGMSAVGPSRLLHLGFLDKLSGKVSDFKNQFDNYKAKVALDYVKYLKGQGQVSDAERKLINNADLLQLSQSEAEFKRTLDDIVINLQQIVTEENAKQSGFKQVGNTSASTGNTPYLKTLGPITGLDGSKYWKYGLDVDLKKGDPVKSPVSGKVIAADQGYNSGFGNNVRIQDANGQIWRLSHLDALNVRPGQTVSAGAVIGKGGNTGKVYSPGGGDGSHLDITVYRSGKPIAARQVKALLDQTFV